MAGDVGEKGDPGVCGPPGHPGDDTICMLGTKSDNFTSKPPEDICVFSNYNVQHRTFYKPRLGYF